MPLAKNLRKDSLRIENHFGKTGHLELQATGRSFASVPPLPWSQPAPALIYLMGCPTEARFELQLPLRSADWPTGSLSSVSCLRRNCGAQIPQPGGFGRVSQEVIFHPPPGGSRHLGWHQIPLTG